MTCPEASSSMSTRIQCHTHVRLESRVEVTAPGDSTRLGRRLASSRLAAYRRTERSSSTTNYMSMSPRSMWGIPRCFKVDA